MQDGTTGKTGDAAAAKSYLPARALMAPMGPKVPKAKKVSKIPKVQKVPDAPEAAKVPDAPKAAKAPDAPKAAKAPDASKAAKVPEAATGTEGFAWRSAISFSAQSTSMLLRTVLGGLGAKFRRTRSERSYSQLYAVLPFPRVAYVFRFEISEPCELVIDLYDTYPATSGALTFIEIPEVNDQNIDGARKILRALVSKLPRPPWKFTAVQRVQHGLLEPDILRARKNWRAIGIAD